LSKGKFFASTWLKEQESKSLSHQCKGTDKEKILSDSYRQFLGVPPTPSECFKPSFSASSYFTPDWSGESLLSKNAKNVKNLQQRLKNDAKKKLSCPGNFNKKLKMAIHSDFLSTSLIGPDHRLSDFSLFWRDFIAPNPEDLEVIEEFCDIYSFKLATIYLFKLRLISTLNFELEAALSESQCLNPSSFLTKFFTRGSSSEIHCEAFKMNQYSWYMPGKELGKDIVTELSSIRELSLSELMRLFSYQDQEKNQENYSHALSHKDFGLFLNNLLIFFPLWSEKEQFSYPGPMKGQTPDVINTRFMGDHLSSLLHSHWLAQESNLNLLWSELLCPDVDSEGPSHTFIQICQELHFITFLVSFAKRQGHPPKETIVKVMKQKYARSQEANFGQESLFSWQQLPKQLVYDRVVLNLQKLPKKNPHHFLLGKINDEYQALTSQGQLVVLTNQKLFVPSQSKKVEALLKNFTLESIFNLEKLEAKGEVPTYIYIFKKRKVFAHDTTSIFTGHVHQEKDSCMSFHFNGKLEQFSMFKAFTEELFNFFKKKPAKDATIYHKTMLKDLSLQFHQDTIKDGKLLSNVQSLNGDHVTHPSFFQSLTKTCSPLETFFSLEEIEQVDKRKFTHSFLGQSDRKEMAYNTVLILNRQNSEAPLLEVCSLKSYPAKREELGLAYFSYFGLREKRKSININLLREYLSSPIGKQITSICLSGINNKIKGRLSSLLLPNFLIAEDKENHINSTHFDCFTASAQELLNKEPVDFNAQFQQQLQKLQIIKKSNWWSYLGLLSHLKTSSKQALEICNESNILSHEFYTNPLISKKISQLQTSPLYPNSEVFIDFHVSRKEELTSSIEEIKTSFKEDQTAQLDFFSQGSKLFSLHGERPMVNFLSFLAKRSLGVSAVDFIQGVEVPSSDQLDQIDQEYSSIKKFLGELFKALESELLNSQKEYILTHH